MQEEQIKISVIIPTFNSAKTLERCLNSIVEQDYNCSEVVLIDGVSTDNTLSIIKRFQLDYPFIKFLSEPDKGIYDAMNKGIDAASGDWIYFLGSDDTLYERDVLSKIAAFLKTAKAEVIYGNVVMRGQNKWNLDNVVFDGEYTMEKFIDRNICHQAILYSRQVIERNGKFSLRYVTNADFDYNLRCFANSAFQYVDLIIANFYVGGQSSHTDDELFHNDRGALLYRYFGGSLFTKDFLQARLYIRRAALSPTSPLNAVQRIFCLLAYTTLKLAAVRISLAEKCRQ